MAMMCLEFRPPTADEAIEGEKQPAFSGNTARLSHAILSSSPPSHLFTSPSSVSFSGFFSFAIVSPKGRISNYQNGISGNVDNKLTFTTRLSILQNEQYFGIHLIFPHMYIYHHIMCTSLLFCSETCTIHSLLFCMCSSAQYVGSEICGVGTYAFHTTITMNATIAKLMSMVRVQRHIPVH